ncbi:MAG TPA: uroporphyrinogen decarboxylase family protein [Bacillota bacterium]|nr:uroporphyrinogen decarboxylase family protein [Bacillota bacterium]
MTVEAEVLGSEIDFGTLACEPKIAKEVFPSVSQVQYRDIPQMIKAGRVEVLADAVSRLARQHPDVPVIGSITGPVSTAASIVDPIPFLKELRKDPANTHQVMDYVSRFLIEYSKVLVESGASLICIGDPTATGEILGPKMFEEYAVKYINQVVDGIHTLGVPVVVHICGNMKRVKELIPAIRSQAISTDALVSLRQLKEEYPHLTTMGNLSTFLLESGTPDNVSRQTSRLVRDGINIIAPACGLSTASSLENINAMTGTVQARA